MSLFSFFSKNKISTQLKESSTKISNSIKEIFTHRKIDEESLENLEETLINADLGVKTSSKIIDELRKNKFNKSITEEEIKEFLAQEITKILMKCQKNLDEELQKDESKPKTLIFNGVNGAGKTTTIGKIAHNLTSQKNKVLIGACDTFRAAASGQLESWAKRSNCEIVTATKDGEDPAAVAYRTLKKAQEENYDFVLIDTAGRLQNKQNLMDELKKITTVLKKLDENAPRQNLLIIDATIGQNSKSQLEIFDKTIDVTGLIVTKLDGSAKGGITVDICDTFQKPIYAIGIGEKITDLQDFDAQDFAQKLVS